MPDAEGPTLRIDAFLPAEMAERCENEGVARANLALLPLLGLAVLAGAFIGLGCTFMTLVASGTGGLPFGVSRLLQGLAFCLGPLLVVVAGAELFGADDLVVMAFMSGRIGPLRLLRLFAAVYVGNLAGAVAVAGLVLATLQYKAGNGVLGATAIELARARCSLGFVQAVALGVMGNALLCLAVWLTLSARSTTDRILSVILPVAALGAAGFEHSVASMYYIPTGLLLAWLDPAFVARLGAGAGGLTVAGFLLRHLLPVTLGNLAGGAGMVGLVYWFIHLRPRRPAPGAVVAPVATDQESRGDSTSSSVQSPQGCLLAERGQSYGQRTQVHGDHGTGAVA